MDMLIAIPSRGRYYDTKSATIQRLPREYYKQTVLFVPRDEEQRYKNTVWNLQMEGITVVPSDATYIGQKRAEIGQYAAANGWSKFCMLDDDLSQFAVRVDPVVRDLRKCDPHDIVEMFVYVARYLDWYVHVGISPRQGNVAYGSAEKPIVVECARMLRFLAYQTEVFNSIEHRMPILEDIDATLQLLNRGHKNAVFFHWSQDQRATGTKGGCSLYRTREFHDANVQRLHEYWPTLTKIRIKENFGEDAVRAGFHKRTEIVVNWEGTYNDYVRRTGTASSDS